MHIILALIRTVNFLLHCSLTVFHIVSTTTEALMVSFDVLLYSLLIRVRDLCFQPHCYKYFHIANTSFGV